MFEPKLCGVYNLGVEIHKISVKWLELDQVTVINYMDIHHNPFG
jgi:hypothetical protein